MEKRNVIARLLAVRKAKDRRLLRENRPESRWLWHQVRWRTIGGHPRFIVMAKFGAPDYIPAHLALYGGPAKAGFP